MEEEDASAQDAVEDGEGAVQRHVLLVFGHGADDEADKHQGHDDQVGSLHDLGGDQLLLVHSGQASKQTLVNFVVLIQLKKLLNNKPTTLV